MSCFSPNRVSPTLDRRDVYRAIRRWSPEGVIHDLGRAFFDIPGPPIADIGSIDGY
jgi:hypothetical protein